MNRGGDAWLRNGVVCCRPFTFFFREVTHSRDHSVTRELRRISKLFRNIDLKCEELRTLRNAVTHDQGLKSLAAKTSGSELPHWRKGGYIKKLSNDPWGNAYIYLQPGTHAEFDIMSLGADSTEGGADSAADIGNWNLDS